MTHDGPDPSGDVMFLTDGLLDKFGFGDGDMLYEVIEEYDLGVDHHDLLVAVVDRLVVPRLDQTVVTSTWPRPTLHNPIRAVTVDGQEASINSTITPDVVEIPVAEILRIARSLPSAEEDADDTPSSPSDVPAPLPLSFGADQLMAGARHVRRTHGGAELHLHHWLVAVLQDEPATGRALSDVDAEALTASLKRDLDDGDLGYPFPAGEARDRATQRARRADHGVVTTDDLAEAVVVAAAGLIRRLVPPSQTTGDTGSISTATATSSGSGGSEARSSLSSLRSALGTSTSPLGVGLMWIVAGILILAMVVAVGWLLYRQRSTGAEEALRNRIGDFTEALAAGDGDAACEMLSDEAADELAERVGRDLDEARRRSCPAAVQVAASERTPAEDELLTDLEAGEVDYDEEWTPGTRDQPDTFEEATATVVVAGAEVALLSENVSTDRAGSWTITDPGPILDLLVPG